MKAVSVYRNNPKYSMLAQTVQVRVRSGATEGVCIVFHSSAVY